MKNIIFIILSVIAFNAKSQITLEHAYDSASGLPGGISPAAMDQLMIIKFEVSGERYVKINRHGKKIEIYNLNHSLLKTIDFSSFPSSPYPNDINIMYISENLFDMDSDIEFMYGVNVSPYYLGIYKSDGTCIFADSAAPAIFSNIPLQQYPIYNTSQGTKMILSYTNGLAKVFDLPGTLTMDIQNANNNLIAMQNQNYLSNPYPNPAVNSTKIDYTLPDSVNEGDIVFYNLQGMEVKRFKVDKTFSTLLVSTADIAAGTYLYQLQTSAVSTEGKKMVVIK